MWGLGICKEMHGCYQLYGLSGRGVLRSDSVLRFRPRNVFPLQRSSERLAEGWRLLNAFGSLATKFANILFADEPSEETVVKTVEKPMRKVCRDRYT